MIRAWNRVAERVQAAQRIDHGLVAVREDDTARADGRADDARPDDAVADRSGRVVAAARDHLQAGRQPRRRRRGRGDLARHVGALVHRGQPVPRNLQHLEDLLRPPPPAQVQQERARCVGDIRGAVAGEHQPDVVLGQQDAPQTGVRHRLFVAEPQDLRGLKAGQRRVPSDLDQPLPPHLGRDVLALPLRALVVPEQRRTDDVVVLVEEDGAVHLACKA